MLSQQLFTLATLLLPVLAVPSPLLTVSKIANAIPGRYIVTLKEGVSRATHVISIKGKITHEFNIINGYAGVFSADQLNELRVNPDIVSIEEDGISHTFTTRTQCVHLPLGLRKLMEL